MSGLAAAAAAAQAGRPSLYQINRIAVVSKIGRHRDDDRRFAVVGGHQADDGVLHIGLDLVSHGFQLACRRVLEKPADKIDTVDDARRIATGAAGRKLPAKRRDIALGLAVVLDKPATRSASCSGATFNRSAASISARSRPPSHSRAPASVTARSGARRRQRPIPTQSAAG